MAVGWVSRDGRHLALGVRHLGTASEPSQEISLTQCTPGVEARLGGETIHLEGARGTVLALRISMSPESLCGSGGFFSQKEEVVGVGVGERWEEGGQARL